MIQSKADLKHYLEQDRLALYKTRKRPRIAGDEIWQYEILLRKTEYYMNCKKNPLGKAIAVWLHFRLRKKGRKLCGFHIPPNAFEEGLSIAHWGPIVVHPSARIGKNCRIHQCVTIGATNGQTQAAHIGDNVFIGPCSSIIGDITIGSDIAIGANSVVTKSFEQGGITIAGTPAKQISGNNSHSNLSPQLDLDGKDA
ncbi:MAG: serine acetyltransferase [Clostridia bacterium]|nr:serine acetyltransferase [Clostridia bacterium]